MCQRESCEHGQDVSQQIPGIDQAIGEQLLEMVQPVTVEPAFAVSPDRGQQLALPDPALGVGVPQRRKTGARRGASAG